MKFSRVDATNLITAGVASGKIQLLGASGSIETSKNRAEMDAAYLLTLLAKLTGESDGQQDGL